MSHEPIFNPFCGIVRQDPEFQMDVQGNHRWLPPDEFMPRAVGGDQFRATLQLRIKIFGGGGLGLTAVAHGPACKVLPNLVQHLADVDRVLAAVTISTRDLCVPELGMLVLLRESMSDYAFRKLLWSMLKRAPGMPTSIVTAIPELFEGMQHREQDANPITEPAGDPEIPEGKAGDDKKPVRRTHDRKRAHSSTAAQPRAKRTGSKDQGRDEQAARPMEHYTKRTRGVRRKLTLKELRLNLEEHLEDLEEQERTGGPSAIPEIVAWQYRRGTAGWMREVLGSAQGKSLGGLRLCAIGHLDDIQHHYPQSYLAELMFGVINGDAKKP